MKIEVITVRCLQEVITRPVGPGRGQQGGRRIIGLMGSGLVRASWAQQGGNMGGVGM